MPDVTIIGAGPAGSAAAILLARRGWAVTLLEQHRFPRDKVCGECLSAVGGDVLGRLGLCDAFHGLRPVRLSHVEIHPCAGRSTRLRLPRPMWGVSRRAFDLLLLDSARAAGATVRQSVRCEALEYGPRLRVRDLTTNTVQTLGPSRVFLADGKAALFSEPPQRNSELGIKAHFAEASGPRDTIELFGCAGFYGGLAAVEGDRWNVAFSVPAALLRAHQGDIAAAFQTILEQNPTLGARLGRAKRISPWLAAPLPRFAVRRHWPAGVVPLGNAAAAIEPIGGEGIGLALRSAQLAADSLDDNPKLNLESAYHRLWDRRQFGCRAAAVVVSRSSLCRLAMPAVRAFAPIRAATLWTLGKHGASGWDRRGA